MLNIVIIRGGLGNQMFGYAFALMLQKKHPFSIVLVDPLEAWFAHNGYELPKLFPSVHEHIYGYYRKIRKLHTQYFTKRLFHLTVEEEQWGGSFYSAHIENSSAFQVYDGYWQTEKYFKPIERKLRLHFEFDIKLLNDNSITLLKEIQQHNAVSVHIRRCDYLESSVNKYYGNICNIDYYNKAISYLLQRQKDVFFYFFSDDPDWVKQNFVIHNSMIISFNSKENSWQDMCLMSYCKHNIIANSTFSWWGAWLNTNKDKIVIAPNKWTNSQPQKDIVPVNWIRIE
jgi:hypothetical protein